MTSPVKFWPTSAEKLDVERDQRVTMVRKGLTRLYFRAVFNWLSKGIGFGFGFGFTTPFGWLVYLLWFWFYDSQVKTALKMCLPRSIIKFPRLASFPRGSSVCSPFFCRYSIQFASFLAIAGNCKSHSKLVNACWLWWITRGIWGNQIPKNILNEWYAFGLR